VTSETGQYRILGALGRGAFGTVYRAEKLGESGFSKTVALKVLNPEMSQKPEVAQRLRDEARMLGLLRHRAILQVDGLVRLGERWAVVMEYVEGVDLKDLASAGPVPLGPALEIVGEIAGALHVAYNTTGPEGGPLRLLHRDIKPSNVFVTSAGEVKILDFGVARADFGSREAETQQLRYGSTGYMSPERLDFIDTAAGDVYALGVVLWELLTGKPYGKTSSKEARHLNRLRENLDQLWEITQGVSEELVVFAESMLAYEPEDRPLARDVERTCGALRMKLGGQFLRDWAEVTVGPLVEARRSPNQDDPNSPTMVLGSGSNRSAADKLEELALDPHTEDEDETATSGATPMSKWMPPTQDFYAPQGVGRTELDLAPVEALPPESRRPWWLFSGALVVGVLVLGVGVWWSLTAPNRVRPPRQTAPLTTALTAPEAKPSGPAEATAVEATAEAKPPAPELAATAGGGAPAPAEEPGPKPTSATTTSSAATSTPPEKSEPKATEPKPDPKAEVEPGPKPTPAETAPATRTPSSTSKGGIVSTQGDALKVELVSASGSRRRASGSVPAGSYRIEATFIDSDPIQAGQVQIEPGAAVVIKCSSRFRRCQAKSQ